MENKIKKRIFKDKNYSAIFFNGKTLRIALDPKKPIEKLDYPEFYDVDIFETMNGLCDKEANCPWCYLNGSKSGNYVENAAEKIRKYFSSMTNNQRPFQVN